MTFWAARDEHQTDTVNVQVTYGPIAIKVAEHYMHLRVFHGELGNLLDKIEAEKAGT